MSTYFVVATIKFSVLQVLVSGKHLIDCNPSST